MAKEKRILIVDDDITLRKALEGKLKKAGFSVVQASDGEEGLELAEEKKPDLILLDIVMPRMDGMTMLTKLRSAEWGKDMPVIILTSLSDAMRITAAMQQDTFDYLVKSDWSIDGIVQEVKERLHMEGSRS